MYHNANLSGGVYSHLLCTESIEYLVDDLYLSVVVAGAESAELGQATLFGAGGDFGGVSLEHASLGMM